MACLAAAVEPDPVGQVGRALLLLALAVGAVAGDALLGEDLLAARGRRLRRPACPDSDSTYSATSSICGVVEQLVEAEARHLRGARVLAGRERMPTLMVLWMSSMRAAPQPVVVVEVGIAGEALRAAAVAGRAVVWKAAAPPAMAKRSRSGSLSISVERRLRELVAELRLARPCAAVDLVGDRGALAVAEHALGVAGERRPRRVDDPVADGPDDGGVEGPQPPPRQRLVQLLDAVPLVAGGLDAGDVVDLALVRRSSAPRCRSSARRSRSRARRCASSKRGPFLGHSA